MQRVMTAIDREQIVRFLRIVRGISPGLLLSMLVTSFLLASALSLYVSYRFLPLQKPVRSSINRYGTATLIPARKPLSNTDIELIVGRNIFNSEGKVGDSVDGAPGKAGKPSDKLQLSTLPLKLVGVIFAGDPYNGLAMLEHTDKQKTSSYMVGDTVQDGIKLVEVYDDRVILEGINGREYLELAKFTIPTGRRKAKSGSDRPSLDRLANRAPPDSFREDGFERKGAAIQLTEEFKRNLLSPDQLTKVLQDAKAEPNMVGNELKGFRLTRIRENSVYEKAGFQNNDIVEEINGIPLRDAAGAIRLLNQLRNEKDIEVRVNRNGQISNMMIKVR